MSRTRQGERLYTGVLHWRPYGVGRSKSPGGDSDVSGDVVENRGRDGEGECLHYSHFLPVSDGGSTDPRNQGPWDLPDLVSSSRLSTPLQFLVLGGSTTEG